MRLSVCFLSAFVLAAPLFAGPQTFTPDTNHTIFGFRASTLLFDVPGRFDSYKLNIKGDPADLAGASIRVELDATSVDTANALRDKHLRSAEFFDVAKYPTITFTSTAVKEVAKGKLEITGTFTLHGVTKQITFPITDAGTGPGMRPGSIVAGFIDGALTINRNDYGITAYSGMIGNDVAITLNVEADKVSGK
ncbi:protein YceI [mine drainage metagenome]|uniref:Protein YceI n=1 Tax=mine drainage metagenome TaxID=410659 RepID=A0A1J5QGI5_9ZZZZ